MYQPERILQSRTKVNSLGSLRSNVDLSVEGYSRGTHYRLMCKIRKKVKHLKKLYKINTSSDECV